MKKLWCALNLSTTKTIKIFAEATMTTKKWSKLLMQFQALLCPMTVIIIWVYVRFHARVITITQRFMLCLKDTFRTSFWTIIKPLKTTKNPYPKTAIFWKNFMMRRKSRKDKGLTAFSPLKKDRNLENLG